eukprot:6207232-Pleurochrysis_carterae.AAC.4
MARFGFRISTTIVTAWAQYNVTARLACARSPWAQTRRTLHAKQPRKALCKRARASAATTVGRMHARSGERTVAPSCIQTKLVSAEPWAPIISSADAARATWATRKRALAQSVHASSAVNACAIRSLV